MLGWPGDGRDGHALYLLYRYIFLYPCRELLVLTITTVTVPRPDANRVRGCGDSMPDTAFRTLWSPPICTVLESSSSHPTEKRWLFWLPFTEKKLLNIRPRGRGKIRWFSKFSETALLPYGEMQAIFYSVSLKKICSLIYSHGRRENLTAFQNLRK